MTLAAGSASDDTTCETSFTSAKVMSLPPVMLYTTPVARSIERSIKGAEVAASALEAADAAAVAEATPTPSMAVPESRMIAFTSAKSTLTFFWIFLILIFGVVFEVVIGILLEIESFGRGRRTLERKKERKAERNRERKKEKKKNRGIKNYHYSPAPES